MTVMRIFIHFKTASLCKYHNDREFSYTSIVSSKFESRDKFKTFLSFVSVSLCFLKVFTYFTLMLINVCILSDYNNNNQFQEVVKLNNQLIYVKIEIKHLILHYCLFDLLFFVDFFVTDIKTVYDFREFLNFFQNKRCIWKII